MAVASDTNKKVYACNGVIAEFAFPYKLFSADDLSVYLRDTDDVLTKLTKTTHYTIVPTGNSYANGATVTTVATYALGNTITLVRELDYTQSADYEENDNFPAEAHEAALDRNCILTQQLAERLARALLVPVDEDRDMTLPEITELKGKYLFFDLTYGKPTAVSAVSVGSATVTDFIKTLLDDADAATARATLRSSYLKVVDGEDYTILDDDGYEVILVTTGASDRTITLPTAADNAGRPLKIIKVDDGAGVVIVDGEGAETINGTATWELTQVHSYVALVGDGTGYHVLAHAGTVYEATDTTAREQNTPVGGTWYNLGSLSLTIPAGTWRVDYEVCAEITDPAGPAASVDIQATLSTANNSESDKAFTTHYKLATVGSVGIDLVAMMTKTRILTLAAADEYFLNERTANENTVNLLANNNDIPAVIRATRIG